MENINCIDSGSVELVTNTKGSFQYLLIGGICGILLLGVLVNQKQSTDGKKYAEIISEQRAMQALVMRTDLSY